MLKIPRGVRPGYWSAEGWTKVLIFGGWLLFWIAGVGGERVPLAVLLIGPAMILAGVVRIARKRPRTP